MLKKIFIITFINSTYLELEKWEVLSHLQKKKKKNIICNYIRLSTQKNTQFPNLFSELN